MIFTRPFKRGMTARFAGDLGIDSGERDVMLEIGKQMCP